MKKRRPPPPPPRPSIFFQPIEPRSLLVRTLTHIRKKLLAGLVTVTPIAVTFIISAWLFRLITGSQWLRRAAESLPMSSGAAATTLALVLTIGIIYIVGLLSTTLLMRQTLRFAEGFLKRIPIVKVIYATAKQITETINRPTAAGSEGRKVVAVEYPRHGSFGIGFATGETRIQGVLYVHVFLPTTPNPTSGWLVLYRHDEVWETSYSAEEGMKLILSGGIVGHEDLVLSPYRPAERATEDKPASPDEERTAE